MFNWFRKKLSQVSKKPIPKFDGSNVVRGQNIERDWKAATDSDSTLNHWGKANGLQINQLLLQYLDRMIARASFESRANPIVEGAINSHANDVVGPFGPQLQFKTGNDKFDARAEMIWKEVAQSIDGSGELSFGDFLKQSVRSFWSRGGALAQYVFDDKADTLVKQRLHVIAIEQLYSGSSNLSDTMLGIKRNKLHRPISYFILEGGIDIRSALYSGFKPIEVQARDIQHVYNKSEPQQWRGVPWLASALQAIAELDEYDTAVLDAAKIAAMMSVLFYNTRDDVDSDPEPKSFEFLRQAATKVPAGWQPFALNSNQPTNNHESFKADKIRDIGRPVGMPLMSIQRDASKHNYSSARFDGQGYARANESIQRFLQVRSIDPFVQIVMEEAILRGELPWMEPRVLRGKWDYVWTPPPHIDPVKESLAQRLQLENKTISPQRACLANNVDFETICKEWAMANEILKRNGLPEMLGPIPTDPALIAAMINEGNNKPTDKKK